MLNLEELTSKQLTHRIITIVDFRKLSSYTGGSRMPKKRFQMKDLDIENVIELMNLYLSEWEHRNEMLWVQVFKHFYATLTVMFLPNIASFLRIDLPNFPSIVFPIVALLLSILFLYVSVGYAKRLEASSKTYMRLMKLLPKKLRRISIKSAKIKYGKLFKRRMTVLLCSCMYIGLIVLSIVMIVYNLHLSTNTSLQINIMFSYQDKVSPISFINF